MVKLKCFQSFAIVVNAKHNIEASFRKTVG